MRIIEVVTDPGHVDTLRGIAEQQDILDHWVLPGPPAEDDGPPPRWAVRMLVRPARQQAVLDAVQQAMGTIEGARINIIPVEATLPRPPEVETDKRASAARSREELYEKIAAGARWHSTYLLLVILSTVVAAIGLEADSVAVVIGAMVIAPLLGPNIALAFASAVGDTALAGAALRTNLGGLALALGLSVVFGLLWPVDLSSHELMLRTRVGPADIALALASGAAAVISLTTGLSSALVGVMVAVALLPPTATLGLMLASGHHGQAAGAALLLAVNIVCVNLAAKVVFLVQGVRPRTWYERQKARQSTWFYLIFWLVLFAFLALAVWAWQRLATA